MKFTTDKRRVAACGHVFRAGRVVEIPKVDPATVKKLEKAGVFEVAKPKPAKKATSATTTAPKQSSIPKA